MGNVFRSVLKMYNLAPGDFPDLAHFQSIAREQDFSQLPKLKTSMIDAVESVLAVDIPRLMDALPRSLDPERTQTALAPPPIQSFAAMNVNQPPPPPMVSSFGHAQNESLGAKVEANPFEEDSNPFGDDAAPWALQDYIGVYQQRFNDSQEGGFVSGGTAKTLLLSSGLPKNVLKQIWDLADVTRDGKLDLYEFVIAMFFADMVKEGHALPATLDPNMVPPT
jgi:EH domain-containing protein 1